MARIRLRRCRATPRRRHHLTRHDDQCHCDADGRLRRDVHGPRLWRGPRPPSCSHLVAVRADRDRPRGGPAPDLCSRRSDRYGGHSGCRCASRTRNLPEPAPVPHGCGTHRAPRPRGAHHRSSNIGPGLQELPLPPRVCAPGHSALAPAHHTVRSAPVGRSGRPCLRRGTRAGAVR